MSVMLAEPSALWWLLALPLVWLGGRYGRTRFTSPQRLLQAAIRSLLIGCLALALARPVISLPTSGESIVYLVDVSHSISSRAVQAAAARIDELNQALSPRHARVLAFGGATGILDDTAALRRLASAPPDSDQSRQLGRDESDLERALTDGSAELGPGLAPRIVLFSDGRETAGDARAAALGLSARGIPVFTAAMTPRNLGDGWVDRIDVPAHVVAGVLVPVVVSVTSQRPLTGAVELVDGERRVATRDVTLDSGTTAVALDVTFAEPGARALTARLRVPGDPVAANDSLAREVNVEPRSRVLYVESQPASAKYLQGALAHAGFDVSVRTPAEVPATVDQLEPWEVVILSDVDRRSLSDASMAALATWVERQGGGLLVTGGANVFGVGPTPDVAGYRHTEIERLLPVTFERNDDPEVALVMVLDRSWSMAGQVISLCKAAAQAAVDALGDDHLLGVVTFNDAFNWDVPVRQVGPNRPGIKATIADIEASGYTVMFPALEQAYNALRTTKARARHIVLLSDGKSTPDEFEALVRKMAAAKITVSTLAVGPGADAFLLADIARWGRGRSYVVSDPKQVLQIFVTEAKGTLTPAFEEGKPIAPLVRAPGFLRGVDLSGMPPLRGRTATVIKDQAVEVLSTGPGDPLLAFWPIRLGRTAVFASDLKDRWGSDWTTWRGYGPFLAAVTHALERPRAAALAVTSGPVRAGRRTLSVSVEARDSSGAYQDLLKPALRVAASDGTSARTALRQVGPGRYETQVVADGRQSIAITIDGNGGVRPASSLVVVDPAAEYRFRPPDVALLQSVASLSGGQFSTDAAALRQDSGRHPASRRALWPAIVGLALFVWFADILFRRVRLFEGRSTAGTVSLPVRSRA